MWEGAKCTASLAPVATGTEVFLVGDPRPPQGSASCHGSGTLGSSASLGSGRGGHSNADCCNTHLPNEIILTQACTEHNALMLSFGITAT